MNPEDNYTGGQPERIIANDDTIDENMSDADDSPRPH